MNIEWAKLKAVAKHLQCSELKAREELDKGVLFIYTKEEAKRIRVFLNRFSVRQTTEQLIDYNGNTFVLIKERV
jgi:hypothetical protein